MILQGWEVAASGVELIGLAGMILVFLSFIVKRWVWLYTFNMSGALLLAIYAYLQGDIIFTVVEAGIVMFLLYRLVNELRSQDKSKRGAARDSGSLITIK
ncbi:MAG: hypothetical protein F7C35_00365 [Desulfurococcales archaeon]|nr:hypothetical protein [Desulfurococcales archaeon]